MMKSSSIREAAFAGEPPPGPPWDEPLGQAPLAFVDLEMTGLNPAEDQIVQLCVERVQGAAVVDRLSSFVRPDIAVPSGGLPVCGITAAELAGAPRFAMLADPLVQIIAGAVVVAHAARHDIAFLGAELARLGRRWSCPFHLDTLTLSRRAFDLPSHRLAALAEALSIDNPTPHRADNDVGVLRALFVRLVAELEPATARDLWQKGRPRGRPSAEIVATAQRALGLSQPVMIRYHPSGRKAEQLRFHVRAVRTDLDPPRVLGYLHDTRGRRELWVERILDIELWDDEH